jgi:hypothetical protein
MLPRLIAIGRLQLLRNRSLTFLIMTTALALPDAPIAQQKSIKEQIVGAWMVVGCEIVQPDGTKSPVVNRDNPVGQFTFTDNGRFAFQVTAE